MTTELTDTELDAWLAEHLLLWVRGDGPFEKARNLWRRPKMSGLAKADGLSSTGDGMLLVANALDDRGYDVMIITTGKHTAHWDVRVINRADDSKRGISFSMSAPRALAEAAMEALRER